MAKLKPWWAKTDIPKDIRVKLWRIMRDNPTFDTFHGQVSKKFDEIFMGVSKKETKYGSLSRDTYNALKNEIMHMPVGDVAALPLDLQGWVIELRPEMEEDLEEFLEEMPPELKLQMGFMPSHRFEAVSGKGVTVKGPDGSEQIVPFREFVEMWLLLQQEKNEPDQETYPSQRIWRGQEGERRAFKPHPL